MTNDRERAISETIRREIKAMRDYEPEPLVDAVNRRLKPKGASIDEHELLSVLGLDDVNGLTRRELHFALLAWDNASEDADWADGTEPQSNDRRERVYTLLDLDAETRSALSHEFPPIEQRDAMIVDPEHWKPWYDNDRREANSFYWDAYRGVLEGKGWDVNAIVTLDRATTEIVERLSDPTADVGYQTKGLVVGHVQSGKTANFTGILAKAIDSGYRLIIVLTGTIELLRTQTQRRLDMELVGKQNILDGVDPDDRKSVLDVDYIGGGDSDWFEGKFLDHGVDIHSLPNVPAIKRLTTAKRDYRKLRLGKDALDFRRAGGLKDPMKPVFHPDNIDGVDARIAVMKKNKTSLENLLHDLRNIQAEGAELPVLIIDDEADQASVNTANPRSAKALAEEAKQRNKINSLIVKMLEVMPRAQYVGYTATPFANVFISPDDAADLFPKDFILSLEPSSEYLGGRHFHDLGGLEHEEKGDPAVSNEAAFVRDLVADGNQDPDGEREELQQALDAFVLSGAIKKWRESLDGGFRFRHHTMLVHTSVRVADQHLMADQIRGIWATSRYSEPASLARLRTLFENDFVRVTNARPAWAELGLPGTFEQLVPFIGDALDEIQKHGDPVVEVNGAKSSDYDPLDFQRQAYWRVMVGGAKLSRGFTVEGLTVTYFRRRATFADTLMQMGRWFGYRPGYKDLVRLYIAREVLVGKRTYDMYEAFTAIVEDEEEFRAQLRQYSELTDDGKPQVRPLNIPPMVFQQLPWLKPVATNRMYNAELQYEGQGGVFKDINALGPREDGSDNVANFSAALPLIDSLSEAPSEFTGIRKLRYDARYGVVSAEVGLAFLKAMKLRPEDKLNPTIVLAEQAIKEGSLVDWAVIAPELNDSYQRRVDGVTVTLRERTRRAAPRYGFAGSEPRHRAALQTIAMLPEAEHEPAGPKAAELATPTRGAILLNFAYDPELAEVGEGEEPAKPPKRTEWPADVDSADVACLLSLALPYAAAPRGRIGFRVKREDLKDAVTVAVDD